jgi:hypothetical protein
VGDDKTAIFFFWVFGDSMSTSLTATVVLPVENVLLCRMVPQSVVQISVQKMVVFYPNSSSNKSNNLTLLLLSQNQL